MGLDMWLDKTNRMTKEVTEVACWRKAYLIHEWFVSNVQDWNNDCGVYIVNKDKIQLLHDFCLEEKAGLVTIEESLLSDGYGEDYEATEYMEDIEYTLSMCIEILNELDFSAYELTYISSD